jgi:hypothetical protein
MGFSFPLAAGPFPWALLAGLFTGAALSRATRPVRRTRKGRGEESEHRGTIELRRTAKWMFFTLFLALAVVMVLGAVFVPGPGKIQKPGVLQKLLFFYGASAALFFLVFRFRRILAPAVLVLAIALIVSVLLFTRALSAYTGETEIGRIRVLAAGGGEMKLEIMPEGGAPALARMEGAYFAPIVKIVIFDDLFVFLGARSWYRFEGVTSFDMEKGQSGSVLRQKDTDFYFTRAPGIPEALWGFYERREKLIPGIRAVQIEMDLKRARELSEYSLRIQNDGGLQIVEIP